MHRFRVIGGALALIAAVVSFALVHGRGSAAQPHACGIATFARSGVVYRVLFAKNGTVQQYLLAESSGNNERDHDVLKAAVLQYGPEAIDAPPLQITSFKPGTNGMMLPDKAVDSCGRVTHFH